MVQMRAALERSCENMQSNAQMPHVLLDLHAMQPALLLNCHLPFDHKGKRGCAVSLAG